MTIIILAALCLISKPRPRRRNTPLPNHRCSMAHINIQSHRSRPRSHSNVISKRRKGVWPHPRFLQFSSSRAENTQIINPWTTNNCNAGHRISQSMPIAQAASLVSIHNSRDIAMRAAELRVHGDSLSRSVPHVPRAVNISKEGDSFAFVVRTTSGRRRPRGMSSVSGEVVSGPTATSVKYITSTPGSPVPSKADSGLGDCSDSANSES